MAPTALKTSAPGVDLSLIEFAGVADVAEAALQEHINAGPEDYDRAERTPDVVRRKALEFAAMFCEAMRHAQR
jgi:hypothetical protein